MDVLKSRKFVIALVGTFVIILIVALGVAFNIDAELILKLVTFIAGFFGISAGGHLITDLTAILKGAATKDPAPVVPVQPETPSA